MKFAPNKLIFVLAVVVSCLGVFVLFQYYSRVTVLTQPFEKNEPELIKVKIFYSNTQKNPEMLDCSLVFPVERVVKDREKVYAETLEQLLLDPSFEEKNAGYKNMIPMGTKLNYVKLEGRTLHADFSKDLDYAVGGSCWVSTIRSQIEDTMKQWPEVQNVLISINGESEIILQP